MRTTIGVAMAAMAVGACGKGGAAGDDPQATVRAFAEAMTANDLDRARALLPGPEACEGQPPKRLERCKQSAQAMRDQIGGLTDDFPKGAHVTAVTKSDEETPDPSIQMWNVELDGKPRAQMMTITLGGRTYPAFAVRRKDR